MEPEKKDTPPGWNDPPTFSYTESVGHVKTPKRNLLTKRVAYPVLSSTKTDQPVSASSNLPPVARLPPMMSPPQSVPKEDNRRVDEGSSPLDIDPETSENMLRTVLDNIDKVMIEKDLLLQNQNKHGQIRKKIDVLKEIWKSKLSDDMKRRVLCLSAVMKDHDKDKANEIQASLMVDFPKVCGEFIPAFRMLINAE